MAKNTRIISYILHRYKLTCAKCCTYFGGNSPPKIQRIQNTYVRTYVHVRKITIKHSSPRHIFNQKNGCPH